MKRIFLFSILLMTLGVEAAKRPNILFAFADDWGWPHAGVYGDPVVKTPTFDRLAKEGALFHNAYVSSPSCTPSRGALLTGQYHWRLEGAGNLWSVFPDKFATYPELLAKAGYVTGVSSKGWGPGRPETGGRQLVGPRFKGFNAFLKRRPKDKPFCYWLGTSDPHRGYVKGSGKKSGMDLSKIKLFAHFPDSLEVRGDVADYYLEFNDLTAWLEPPSQHWKKQVNWITPLLSCPAITVCLFPAVRVTTTIAVPASRWPFAGRPR